MIIVDLQRMKIMSKLSLKKPIKKIIVNPMFVDYVTIV